MSLGQAVLDELSFIQAELPTVGTLVAAPLNTRCTLTAADSQRKLQLHVPYFVRQLGPADLGPAWKTFCLLLRQHGIPLFSPAKALQAVPAAAVPPRFGTRYIDQPIDAEELTTADAFELACYDLPRQYSGQVWQWSREILPNQFPDFVRAVRQAAGGDTPIGLGLPLGCHVEDLRRAVKAEVDFICLSSRFRQLDAGDLRGLCRCRQMLGQFQREAMPIFVTAPLNDLEQAHKLIALGASAVCIDSLLRPLLPTAPAATTMLAGAGMLAGLTPVAAATATATRRAPELIAVQTALAEYRQRLSERLRCVGVSDLTAFNADVLRSCSERAERVTGVASLASD